MKGKDNMPMSRIYNPFVGAGSSPTPSPQAEEVATLNFQYTDTSALIFTAPAGAKIISAMVVVSTAFDDPNASIMIGDSILNNRLMLASQSDLFEADSYQAYREFIYASATQVNFYLSPGISTAGQGFVVVFYNLE